MLQRPPLQYDLTDLAKRHGSLLITIFGIVLSFCDLPTLAHFATVSYTYRAIAQDHLGHRTSWVLGWFLPKPALLRAEMRRCGVVIVGRTALHVALGHDNLDWKPDTLDFAIPATPLGEVRVSL